MKKDVYFIKETLGQSAIMKNFKIVATYNDFEKAFNRYLRNKKKWHQDNNYSQKRWTKK